jgi:arylsulfatase A-like enzyme
MPRCILLITIDCLRADHVASYGYHRATTPTIDALAEHGVLWEQAHSLSSWTKPSVASMLTGLYPSEHGAYQGIKRSKGRLTTTDILNSSRATLTETLSEAGWRCAAFINNAQLGEFTQLNRGFETYVPMAGKADRLISMFREWLTTDLQSPSFAYLHFLEAHWPYKPRRRHMKMFGGDRDTNHFRDYSARDFGKLRRAIKHERFELPESHLEQMIQMYDSAIRRLDGKIKIILATLKELGLREETALFITADHGEEFLEHGGIGHGQGLYEELTHVPLIVQVPGGAQGQRRTAPISQVDLAHSLMSVADVAGDLPGVDLLGEQVKARPVCSELRIGQRYMHTIQSGSWKLHRRFKFETENGELAADRTMCEYAHSVPHVLNHELYDLDSDPGERSNLADEPGHAAVRAQLEADLDHWWREATPEQPSAKSETEIDTQVVERLRDLGYID